MPQDLTVLQVETNMRLTNARMRGGRAEIDWLVGIKEALQEVRESRVLAATKQATIERRDAPEPPDSIGEQDE